MAEGEKPSASSVNSKSKKPLLPYRQFKDWPTDIFVQDVLGWLLWTAQPELHEGLFRNPIPKDVTFFIIRKDLILDRRKRPEGDSAPCPMCASNKFLRGSLIYIPPMQCCAVIGNCCADKEARAIANREYKQRTLRDHEEQCLLDNLPLIEKKLSALRSLMPAAEEARRIYRRFRADASLIQHHLRQLRRTNWQLIVPELLTTYDRVDGPTGFRQGGLRVHEHKFGPLEGNLATIKDYNPVKQLEYFIRQLGSIDTITDDAELIDFITRINERQRHAAVVIIEGIDKAISDYVLRLRSFVAFFSRDNIARLHAYGIFEKNPFNFTAEYRVLRTGPMVIFERKDQKCTIVLNKAVEDIHVDWPKK